MQEQFDRKTESRDEGLQLTRQELVTKMQAERIAGTRLKESSRQSMAIWEQSLTKKKELLSPSTGTKERSLKHGWMSEEVCPQKDERRGTRH